MGLYRHQFETIKEMIVKKRLACWLEMGLGKTICALMSITALSEKAIIICPNYLKRTWLNEAAKWAPHLNCQMVEGTAATRSWQINSGAQVLIINYESFRIEQDAIKQAIKRHGYKILVCDESQALKNKSSAQTKAMLKIAKDFDYVWLLSGTPITNNFGDYYSQYKILLPEKFRTFTEFKNRFLVMGGYMNYQVKGHQNEAEFKALTDANTIRLKKKDCLDLPEKIYQTVYCDMSPAQAQAYEQMKKESVLMLDAAEPKVVAQMAAERLTRLRQIAAGWCGRVTETGEREIITIDRKPPKLQAMIEMAVDNVSEHQIIIWTAYRHDVDVVSFALATEKIEHRIIQGKTTPEDRQKYIDDFQAGKFPIMIINNSIVAGMTLTAADIVFRYQSSYSYAAQAQAEDRCHRIGQKKNVTYYDFVVKGTVEESIMKILERKGDLMTIVDRNEWRKIFLNQGE